MTQLSRAKTLYENSVAGRQEQEEKKYNTWVKEISRAIEHAAEHGNKFVQVTPTGKTYQEQTHLRRLFIQESYKVSIDNSWILTISGWA